MKLNKFLSWKRNNYLLGITDKKIPCWETKSIIFFLHAFLCKQRCRRHDECCSSFWLKFVKIGPIFPTFFPNKRRWEPDRNISSWAQRCFKKSFLALEKRTFQVKSKTTKIFNKAGHFNSFLFLCCSILRHSEGGWMKPLLISRMSS